MIYGILSSSGFVLGTTWDIMHNHGAWIAAGAHALVGFFRATGLA